MRVTEQDFAVFYGAIGPATMILLGWRKSSFAFFIPAIIIYVVASQKSILRKAYKAYQEQLKVLDNDVVKSQQALENVRQESENRAMQYVTDHLELNVCDQVFPDEYKLAHYEEFNKDEVTGADGK